MSRAAENSTSNTGQKETTCIRVAMGDWEQLLLGEERSELEKILPAYLLSRRWFGAKARQIRAVHIWDAIPVGSGTQTSVVVLARVEYAEGAGDRYVLPLTVASGDRAVEVLRDLPHAVVSRLEIGDSGEMGVLYDAVQEPHFCMALLGSIAEQERLAGWEGELVASTTHAFGQLRGSGTLEPRIVRAEQSNSSIIFGDRLILKLFRRIEAGTNPDLEIGRFLTEQSGFANIPPVAGGIEYHSSSAEPMSLAILQGFVSNRGDAWQYTLSALDNYYTHVRQAKRALPEEISLSTNALLELAMVELPALAYEMLGSYAESARLLGQRTGEMHLALAADTDDASFAPEPFTEAYQRTIYDSLSAMTQRVFRTLHNTFAQLPADIWADAQTLIERQDQIMERVRPVLDQPISAVRTRFHGDYHLGQVLYTGSDFYIIDFEGEPARPLSERRLKRSPLQDVAGMLRSFHYAAYAALLGQGAGAAVGQNEMISLGPWARAWHRWVSTAFLKAYLTTVGRGPFLPESRAELRTLLDAYLLDKAVYELGYELNNRPDWVRIPMQGILQLLDTAK